MASEPVTAWMIEHSKGLQTDIIFKRRCDAETWLIDKWNSFYPEKKGTPFREILAEYEQEGCRIVPVLITVKEDK